MNRKEEITRWDAVIKESIEQYRRIDKACDKAIAAGCMDANGPLFAVIWQTYDALLKCIDVDGWIQWHIYDNNCGKLAKEARGCGNKPRRKIRTHRQIAELIVQSKEHEDAN